MDDYSLLDYYSMMTKNDTYYDYYFNYEETLFDQALKWFEIAFIVPIGVLGNILVICVLSKKTYEKSSTAVFFSALAVSDILILVSGLYNILTVGNDTNIDCKIFTSLWICSGQTSSCILATVAVERAVSVQNPHKAKFIFTARSAKIIMISMVLFVFVLNAIVMVWYDIGGDKFFEEMYCHSNDLVSSIVHVFPWIDFCLGFALPFIVIAICSTIIIFKLRQPVSGQKKENGKGSSVTRTLLSANACFLILLAPSRIYNIMYPIPLVDDVGFLTFHLFSTISQVNASANFFLYFLNARIFRADVKGLLCCNTELGNSKSGSTM